MGQFLTTMVQFLSAVPAPIAYALAAVWVGMESAGIGVPIEPMMLFIGSLSAQAGHGINFFVATGVVALGCLVFATIAYVIGRTLGTQAIARVGHFVGLTDERAAHIELWLRHRGLFGVLVARVTPVVRTFGSYVMGAADVPFPRFVFGTCVGSVIYCGVWIFVGHLLGTSYTRVLGAVSQYQWIAVTAVALVVVGYVVLHYFWGRMGMRRIDAHFHHHMAAATAPVASNAKLE